MLLPSALSCPQRPSRPRLQPSLFASPPASPPAQSALFATCRALQSMLSSTSTSTSAPQSRAQLPTPPMRNATLPVPVPSPMKLRLRSAGRGEGAGKVVRKGVVKRQAPRGGNKRRRGEEEDVVEQEQEQEVQEPSTPKRVRFAPAEMPFGLERRDFERLHEQHQYCSDALGIEMAAGAQRREEEQEDWTSEEDGLLVELVLEKLKLSRSEWQDCARSLGRDGASVGRRWRSLVGGGEVGLRGRGRRERESGRIHATWR